MLAAEILFDELTIYPLGNCIRDGDGLGYSHYDVEGAVFIVRVLLFARMW